ncbi:MAG: NeuD/PglB/VioB family sugar acetyltransferase [Xanthobacteraceae bacterium]|nr:NeuD/PglB/VioB family sugar acetyltransferase [Xanthobacteraceae bacterium]
MKVIVLGTGGHARVLIEAFRSREVSVFGVAGPDSFGGAAMPSVDFIGHDEVVAAMNPSEVWLVNGCGNKASAQGPGLSERRRLYEKFSSLRFKFPPVVHACAVVATDATLEDGSQVMAGAIIQSGAHIGRNVILNTGSIVEHDCSIGAHSHIAPGAVLCGAVKVGEEAHVGAGAIILQGRFVGEGAVVGAGQVIRSNVANSAVLVQLPTSS